MLSLLRKLFLPGLALASFGLAVSTVLSAQQTVQPLPPPIEPNRTPFAKTLAGSGIAEPQTEVVSIGSHLPGVVTEVRVQVGCHVAKGTVLFQLDDAQQRAEVAVAEAALAAAQADLSRLESLPRAESVPPSEAKVRWAKASLVEQEDLLGRSKKLLSTRAIGQEEFVKRQQAYSLALEEVSRVQAEHELLLAGASIEEKQVARAAVLQAKAQVEQAKVRLDRLRMCAPIDGEILKVNVRPGEYVGAPPSQALIVLGGLEKVHVRVDVDEHDIPRFRTDAPARATVRGGGGKEFPLAFVRVEPYVIPKKSLTGDNTERVDTRVLQVLYALPPGERSVFVGQQLDVFIDLAEPGKAVAKK